jgi:hypothetical protein
MTILAGVRSREAVVIGSDSQEASGVTRRTTQKLLVPQPGLVIAWAGFKDVAQAFTLSIYEEALALSEKRSVVAKAASDRFRQIREQSDVAHRSETNEFMLGWFSEVDAKPVALHLRSQGAFTWVEDWEYAGSQLAVATARTVEASVSYLATENLATEQLSLVVLKVLRDSITAAGPQAMIGGEVRLAAVTRTPGCMYSTLQNSAPRATRLMSGMRGAPSSCPAPARALRGRRLRTAASGRRPDLQGEADT